MTHDERARSQFRRIAAIHLVVSHSAAVTRILDQQTRAVIAALTGRRVDELRRRRRPGRADRRGDAGGEVPDPRPRGRG